jgi:hypothetical protein
MLRYIENPPRGTGPTDWPKLNKQTKMWLAELDKLNLIALRSMICPLPFRFR